jgi:hypothetical protein
LITPLQKRTLDGSPYTRRRIIEIKIVELASLSCDELIARCEIRQKDDPGYVPSECLLYFIRTSRTDNSNIYFERLYKILAERILRSLPKPENLDGQTISFSKSAIREKVFERFLDLLLSDRNVYLDKLDYYEINFDSALKNLRRDAQDQVWRNENRLTTLYDEDTGEPTTAVEHAAESFDPFNASAFADDDYRSCLYTAIDTLPPQQRRIIVMILRGIPIHSKDHSVPTIAKVLGKDEKTIRKYRDKAYAVLRAALNKGEEV